MPKVERQRQRLRFSAGHAPNPSATPHRPVPTSLHSTTDNQPNRSTDPKTKPVHTDDRAHCSDARITVRQPPYAGAHHGRQGGTTTAPRNTPRASRSCPLKHIAKISRRGPHSKNPITTTAHTHSPHLKTSTPAKLIAPDQAAHLQSIRASDSFAQGESRGNWGWPGHRHPKTTTPQTVPGDTEAHTSP